jgi:hypothetical protein
MKRAATWVFYAVGALAIAYLALYAYVMFTGRPFEPGDPIHIFRKPDSPELGMLKTDPTPYIPAQDTQCFRGGGTF